MANHKLLARIYPRFIWQTYRESHDDSESVEKVTINFIGAEEDTNYDWQKRDFSEAFDGLPGC